MNFMIRNLRPAAFALVALAGLALATAAFAAPVGTAFTYQGRLQKDAGAYSGTADFVFRLFDDPADGTQVGADVSVAGVTVTDGFFTVELDFGPVFTGTALWLSCDVQTPGDADLTALLPRQSMAPTPYALYALSAPGGGGGGSQWTSDAYGIAHPGNVGIGGPSRVDRRLMIDGAALGNPLWLRNSTANYAALVVENDAVGGYGLYDAWSDLHYLTGRIGIGTLTPVAKIEVASLSGLGIKTVSAGSTQEPINAAIRVHGATGTGATGTSCVGVWTTSTDNRAVNASSVNNWGVYGECSSAGTLAILGTPNEGLYASSPSALKPAAHFVCPAGGVAIDAGVGLVKVKTLQILGGADLAEPFDVASASATAAAEPGCVVVIDPAHPGDLRVSESAYDTRVAGVISGANDLAPGMVMQSEGHPGAHGAHPVALTGRVWCKVDASFGAIHPGDLLVSSPTPGHAMKAADLDRRAGAVIGKAMTALDSGTGLVLVLVSLQ